MQTELQEFVSQRLDEVREGLDGIQSLLLGNKYAGWRNDLEEASDAFHTTVHRVIDLFQLSGTPGSQLEPEVDEEEQTQWARFDAEFDDD